MENAVEFLCCFNLACEKCASLLKICSFCAKPFEHRPSVQVRRIIGDLKTKCEYCAYETTRSELNSHLKTCQKKPQLCYICNTLVLPSDLIPHAISFHSEEILTMFQGNYEVFDKEEKKIPERQCTNLSKTSRIGKSGKYYCGKPLDTLCTCCNGLCGRSNGCNCVECMKLDIEARALPKGYLVNQGGMICKMNMKGKVYCMCYEDESKRCGKNEVQCIQCGKMEKVWKRYESLVN